MEGTQQNSKSEQQPSNNANKTKEEQSTASSSSNSNNGTSDSIIKKEASGGMLEKALEIGIEIIKKEWLIVIIVIALHAAAIVLFVNLPDASRRTYVSEKNLQCGVEPTYNVNSSEDAIKYTEEFRERFPIRSIFYDGSDVKDCALWIQKQLEDMGLDTYLHSFPITHGKTGWNVVGMLRADRSPGTESNVLTTRFDVDIVGEHELRYPDSSGAVGLLLSLAKHFVLEGTHTWHARDVIFVFTTEGDEVSGIDAWLNDYHTPKAYMQRAGRIFGAISVENAGNHNFNRILVSPEGLGGFLPNLDMLNVITTTSFTQYQFAGMDIYNPGEKLDGTLEKMLLFIWHLSLSFPKGNYAFFSKYGVNSVGVSSIHSREFTEFMKKMPVVSRGNQYIIPENYNLSADSFGIMGKLLDSVIHNLDNADEQLHQSFRWYHMSGAVDFLDTGGATQPYFPIIGALLIMALHMFFKYDKFVTECSRALPSVASIMFSSFLICMLPNFLALVKFLPHGVQPAEFHELNSFVSIVGGYVVAVVLAHFFVFSRIASMVSISLFGKGQIEWYAWKFWTMILHALVIGGLLLANIQFGYILTVGVLPYSIFMQPSNYFIIRLVKFLIVIVSVPIPILFVYAGFQEVGFAWLLRLFISSMNWGSLFYSVVVMLNLPLFIFSVKCVFWRNS